MFKIPRHITLFLLEAYQRGLRPYFLTGCYFYPSCSEYAKICFTQLRWSLAFKLALKRLCKCHPFGKSTSEVCIDHPENASRWA